MLYLGSRYLFANPRINTTKKTTTKIKNNILAIAAAPEAIPPKPNMAATMAMIKNISA